VKDDESIYWTPEELIRFRDHKNVQLYSLPVIQGMIEKEVNNFVSSR